MNHGTILIVSPDAAVTNILRSTLTGTAEIIAFRLLQSALDYIYNDIPHLLIIDLHADQATSAILNTLKEDPLFASLPILALLDEQYPAPDWGVTLVEDYIWKADLDRDLAMKAQLCLLRTERVVEVNPLTRLPGNISINRQIQKRLDQSIPFALAYFDLDNFKPFNDHYGFSRGDDVIKITGRLLINIVKSKSPRHGFVGHIGGDDFVCMMEPSLIEETCQEMIAAFDRIVRTFYDQEDRDAGFIRTRDREGTKRDIPIVSLSIGIADVTEGVFSHYGEVTSIAAEMKKYAKQQTGSCFRINRRLYPETPADLLPEQGSSRE